VRLRKETFINLLSKKEEILNKQNSRCKSKLCSEILGKVSCRMINSWESERESGTGGDGGGSQCTPHTHHLHVALLGIFKQMSAGFQWRSELQAQAAQGVGVIGSDTQNHSEETHSTPCWVNPSCPTPTTSPPNQGL
jgi:hypothetical protein